MENPRPGKQNRGGVRFAYAVVINAVTLSFAQYVIDNLLCVCGSDFTVPVHNCKKHIRSIAKKRTEPFPHDFFARGTVLLF